MHLNRGDGTLAAAAIDEMSDKEWLSFADGRTDHKLGLG